MINPKLIHMYKFIYLFIVILVSSCMTPQEALDKRKFKTAFRKATRNLQKGKDIDSNIKIIRISGEKLVQKELSRNASLVRSNKTKNLLRVQNRYYTLLKKIGKTNIKLDGVINGVYDKLCSAKKELDFQIVDNFYQAGDKLMDSFYDSGEKQLARNAYAQYKDCRKYEGDLFFNDLSYLLNEAHEEGIVYYIGSDYGSSFFFKKLPENTDIEPDCDINVKYGHTNFYESENSHSDSYSKLVKVGTEAVTDTAGHITYKPIFGYVNVTVRITKVTVTASRNVDIDIINLTGQCNVKSRNFTSSVSDDYENIEIFGDHRALPSGISACHGSCSYSRLRSRLDTYTFCN